MKLTHTHDVKTISNDYFTITYDAVRDTYIIVNTFDVAGEHEMTPHTFRKIFKNDTAILRLFV